MTAASVLSDALALIEKPSNFTAEGIVLDKRGNEVPYDSDRAVKFSVVGALLRLSPNPDDLSKAAVILRRLTWPHGMFEFEEMNGHQAVLKCMRSAIKAAEQVAA